MKVFLTALFTLGTIFTAEAAPLSCLKLTERAVLGLGRANSGPSMVLNSVKAISIRKTEFKTITYKYEVYLQDKRNDMYDGYYVTAQTFSGGDVNGCLINKIEMFQND